MTRTGTQPDSMRALHSRRRGGAAVKENVGGGVHGGRAPRRHAAVVAAIPRVPHLSGVSASGAAETNERRGRGLEWPAAACASRLHIRYIVPAVDAAHVIYSGVQIVPAG